MTWKSHLANAETKAREKLAILRKLAGINWGAQEKIRMRSEAFVGTLNSFGGEGDSGD